MSYWAKFALVVLSGVVVAVAVALLFRLRWKGQSKWRNLAQNVALSLGALFLVFVLAELYFKLFFWQSDGLGCTLASQSWFNRYWKPVNSLGYRDYEWTPQAVAGRTKVMVLGDSFVAGYGIERIEDRFSDVLAAELGPGYAVMTVARNGWNTNSAMAGGFLYPYRPDVIVLSHYVNDIEVVEKGEELNCQDLLNSAPSPLRPLIEESYFTNFLYWRVSRLGLTRWAVDHWNWQKSLYDDPVAWNVHQDDLRGVIRWCSEQGVDLFVVVFPNLLAVEESRPMTSKVVNLFRANGVPVLDVAAMVENDDPRSLVVNRLDPHPSVELHRRIAAELYEMMSDARK
jgi:hypothetical protein